MEALRIVQQTIVYLEDHMLDNIDMNQLAEYIGETAYHLNQTFTMICGMNTEEYVYRRRLSDAADELIKGDQRLVDVAEKYGYKDAHAFSHDFSDYHGFSPVLVRTHKESVKRFSRLYVKYGVTEHPPLSYTILDFQEIRLAGYRQFIPNQELLNHFLIPDLLFEAVEKGHLNELHDLRSQQIYISVRPLVDGLEIFYGVPHDGNTLLEVEYLKERKCAVFTQQGHIDFLYNQVWQGIEQQVSVTLNYLKNDHYVSVLLLPLDFDSHYTKMTFYLPIQ
ncbi:helix-turn-helix domain-containing protein [Macrococcus lamae]|uniref:AraC family transcriptional regulator n=1 Tax=Macrococcus lamae TaxID=198484 RepID=A0A4R6BXG4_9STAP|nr:helix-turn-helix domain-containing protein [Macrococcus lamae]TDM13181.1 AraC family transcriptional regulator [Macrococcus lamae]